VTNIPFWEIFQAQLFLMPDAEIHIQRRAIKTARFTQNHAGKRGFDSGLGPESLFFHFHILMETGF
jgi:hypothetical protein